LYEVLDPKAAAEYLHVSEPTLIDEAENARVPGRKIGAEWRFLRLALADWLRVQPAPKPEPKPGSSKERMLALAGAWKDDPTADLIAVDPIPFVPIPFVPTLPAPSEGSRTGAAEVAREKAAFETLLPDLLARFPGQYAAVYGGELVATGPDEMDVIEEAYTKVGTVPMYVGLVTDQPPPLCRIPSFTTAGGRRQV
jgi:hypothetical protein